MEATWPPISGDCGKTTDCQSTLACLTVWPPSAPWPQSFCCSPVWMSLCTFHALPCSLAVCHLA